MSEIILYHGVVYGVPWYMMIWIVF